MEDYFKGLAEAVVNNLNTCGFPLCKGNIMATNPRYFGDMELWKKKTKNWITVSTERGETSSTYTHSWISGPFTAVNRWRKSLKGTSWISSNAILQL